ncbi:TRAP transporter permease [Chloroflexota bacterium]
MIIILVILAGSIYIAVNVMELVLVRIKATLPEVILGTGVILAMLEATRRTVGLPVVILIVVIFLYTLYCNFFPGVFWGPGFSWQRIVGDAWLFPGGIYGTLLHAIARYAFVFIMLACFLMVGGGSKFFLDLAFALAGRFSGGPAKVAIVGSSLFGTMSGASIANVAATGAITIPMMKSIGYKPYYAGAVEAVASTGGILMPPVMGMTAFIMADFMGVPYWEICVAAFIPAILYYVSLFSQVHFQAKKLKLIGLPSEQLPSALKTLMSGWHFILTLVILVYFLGVLRYSPTTACLYALWFLLVAGMFRKETRWTPRRLVAAVEESIRVQARVIAVCGAVGAVVTCLMITGMTLQLTGLLLEISGGSTFILLVLAAVTCIVLGMGLPSMVAYIMMAVLITPALIQMGVPLFCAHLFVFYFAITHVITPPVCTSSFVAAAIADGPMMKTGFQAMRLGIVAYIVPFAFVYTPALVFKATLPEVALAFLWAVTGVVSISIVPEYELCGYPIPHGIF